MMGCTASSPTPARTCARSSWGRCSRCWREWPGCCSRCWPRASSTRSRGGRSLVGPVLALAALIVAAAVLGAANSYVLGRTAERVVLDVRTSLAQRLVRLRVDELDHASPGDLISRTTADSSLLRSAATTALVDLVDGSLRFVGALLFMGWLDLRLLAVTMTVLVGVGFTVGVVVPRIRAAVRTAQEAVSAVATALYRALGAARTVKASGTEATELATVGAAVATAYTAGVRGVRLNALLTAVTGLSIQVPFLAVLGVGGALVARGELPVSTLVAFLLYLFYLIGPIGQLVGGTTTLQQGLAAADRIAAVDAMAVEDVPLTPPLPAPPATTRTSVPGRRTRPAPSACASSACRSRTPAASRCSTR